MPKLATPLTESQIESLSPRPRAFTIGDGGGLYMEVEPSGRKVWRMKYRRGHKETSVSFGSYPDVSLTEARQRRDDNRKLIAQGIDPVEQKREQEGRERAGRRSTLRLRMSMSDDGSLTIDKPAAHLTLNPAQVAALRAFLSATTDEATGASTCQN